SGAVGLFDFLKMDDEYSKPPYDEKKTLHPEGPSVRALAKILRILCQALTFHAKRYNYVKVCHYLSR
ncbi:MAG: hypothetical protein J6W73_04800, partial [Verrucomicrobia bacterium]|nr:hypothetical protein [Verrucomicrobiota bacterium]